MVDSQELNEKVWCEIDEFAPLLIECSDRLAFETSRCGD